MQLEYSEFGLGRLSVFNPRKVETQIKRSATRAGAIIKVVEKLLAAGDAPVLQARYCLETAHGQEVLIHLNRLKGCVSNFGGIRTCEIIEEIEILLLERTEHPALSSMFDILALEFSRFLHAAESWLVSQKTQLLPREAPSHAVFSIRFLQWQSELDDADFQALASYQNLRAELTNLLPTEVCSDLHEAMQQLDFATALEILRSEYPTAHTAAESL